MPRHTTEIRSWVAYHDALKADPARWVAETSNHVAWPEPGMCSGTCDECKSTVTIGLEDARAAGALV